LNVHALLAAGVNADGHREILGLQATSGEDGAGWLAFFRDLTACGLTGVQLVTSDAHAGLVVAIGAGDGETPLGGHSPAGGHSTFTMCLAVLGSLAALVLLVASALARRPAVVDPPDGVHPVGARFSLGRPPPWTVPSLHQLSLLRV